MADDTTAYAEDVLAGRIVAGRLVRLACERHLNDIETGAARGLSWHPDTAQAAFDFWRLCPHLKGRRWAGETIDLAPWQRFVIGSAYGWKKAGGFRRFRVIWCEVARKNGKAMALDTDIPTPGGWAKLADIRPGMLVFGGDGRPVRVLAESAVMTGRPCYRVVFSDGTSVIADAEHLWFTRTKNDRRAGRPGAVRTTREVAETLHVSGASIVEKSHRLPDAPQLLTEPAALPVDPYVLGAWLGDGHSATSRLTCGKADLELLDHVRAAGCSARVLPYGESPGAVLVGMGQVPPGRGGSLHTALGELGVRGNKHIPPAYLWASASQRMALLQGLMDTDGYVSKAGQCEYTTTSERLRDGVLDLLRSLGFKATLVTHRATLGGKDCGPKYRVQFWADRGRPCFRLARKSARLKPAGSIGRGGRRVITAVEPVDSVPVKCIQVAAADGMFLAGRGMVPTHNSTMVYPAGIHGLVCDNEPGAEVYSVATKRDQAKIIFDLCRAAVNKVGEFRDVIEPYRFSLAAEESMSKMEALSADADTLDGLSPSCVLADEIHKWKGRALWDVIETGMGARSQPLMWATTTAGDEGEQDVYGQEHAYGRQVLEGTIQDDSRFVYIATLDPEDDWQDPRVWVKANPNIGVSVRADEIGEAVTKAKNSPAAANAVRRLRLNCRVQDADAWIPLQLWDAGKESRLTWEALKGYPCYGGLDLASSSDFAALCLLFPLSADLTPAADHTRPDRYGLLYRLWLPETGASYRERRLRELAQPWVRDGWVTPTPGDVIDHGKIEEDILAVASNYELAGLAYDPFNAAQLATRLQSNGIDVQKFPQNMTAFAEPTKAFEAAVLAKTIRHDGNPCVRWMVDNAVLVSNAAGHRMPSRKKSRNKIDAVAASVMAFGRVMADPPPGPSYYDTNPLELV